MFFRICVSSLKFKLNKITFQLEVELMAKEHEAGKRSITEILKFSTRELQQICKKIDTIKTSTDVQKDKSALSNILSDAQKKFDRQWEDRKQMLTRHAKFRLHSAETDSLSNNLSDVSETLKIRTSLEESLMSVNSASNFVAHLETTKLKVKTLFYIRCLFTIMNLQCKLLNEIIDDVIIRFCIK